MLQKDKNGNEVEGIAIKLDDRLHLGSTHELSLEEDIVQNPDKYPTLICNSGTAGCVNKSMIGQDSAAEDIREKQDEEFKKGQCRVHLQLSEIFLEMEQEMREDLMALPEKDFDIYLDQPPFASNGFMCGANYSSVDLFLDNQFGVTRPHDSLDYFIDDLMGPSPSSTSFSTVSGSSFGSYGSLDDILMEPQAPKPDPLLSPVIISNVNLYRDFGGAASADVLATSDPIILPQTDLTFTTGNPVAPAMPQGSSPSGFSALTAQPSL